MTTASEGDGRRGACHAAAPLARSLLQPPAPGQRDGQLQRRPQRTGLAALLVAALVAGCSSGPTMPPHAAGRPPAPRVPVTARAAGSLVRVPRPDYSDPASVAEAFYI